MMAEYLSEGESRFMFKRLKAAVDDQTKVRILSSSTLNGTNPWQLPTHLELTLRSTCIIIVELEISLFPVFQVTATLLAPNAVRMVGTLIMS